MPRPPPNGTRKPRRLEELKPGKAVTFPRTRTRLAVRVHRSLYVIDCGLCKLSLRDPACAVGSPVTASTKTRVCPSPIRKTKETIKVGCYNQNLFLPCQKQGRVAQLAEQLTLNQ